jgi:hypothetical protein
MVRGVVCATTSLTGNVAQLHAPAKRRPANRIDRTLGVRHDVRLTEVVVITP